VRPPSQRGAWSRKRERDAPLLAKTLGVLEEVAGALVGLVELGLDLVAADVHGVEVRLKHAELLQRRERERESASRRARVNDEAAAGGEEEGRRDAHR